MWNVIFFREKTKNNVYINTVINKFCKYFYFEKRKKKIGKKIFCFIIFAPFFFRFFFEFSSSFFEIFSKFAVNTHKQQFFLQSSRTTIYKNLYVSILAIEILFLVGIELNETNVLCGFTSTFLHCSFLCTIAWLFFEGKHCLNQPEKQIQIPNLFKAINCIQC